MDFVAPLEEASETTSAAPSAAVSAGAAEDLRRVAADAIETCGSLEGRTVLARSVTDEDAGWKRPSPPSIAASPPRPPPPCRRRVSGRNRRVAAVGPCRPPARGGRGIGSFPPAFRSATDGTSSGTPGSADGFDLLGSSPIQPEMGRQRVDPLMSAGSVCRSPSKIEMHDREKSSTSSIARGH